MEKLEVILYETQNGDVPFQEWMESLDRQVRLRVDARIQRLRLGNLGDWKVLSNGVFELRLKFGAGYRIYYSRVGSKLILLLCAGDKSTQKSDIAKAQLYYEDFIKNI